MHVYLCVFIYIRNQWLTSLLKQIFVDLIILQFTSNPMQLMKIVNENKIENAIHAGLKTTTITTRNTKFTTICSKLKYTK